MGVKDSEEPRNHWGASGWAVDGCKWSGHPSYREAAGWAAEGVEVRSLGGSLIMGRTQAGKGGGGMSSPLGVKSLLVFTVLLLAWLAGFLSRLFAVIRFESIIHEFDPW